MDPTLNDTPELVTSTSSHEPVVEQNSAPIEAQPAIEQNDDAKSNDPVSSTEADKDAKKADLLSVIQDALNKSDDSKDSSTKENQSETANQESNVYDSPKDEDKSTNAIDKQQEKLPFHNHPRWKEMMSEREALKPRADQYDRIMGFMHSNGLSPQEMAEGLKVMALMRNNPQEAYKAIKGYSDRLAELVGDKLPDDVRQRVENGLIDDQSAKELSQLKAERRAAEEQAMRLQSEALAANQRAMHDVVATWEQKERAKDPDWDTKYEMVKDRVLSIMSQERPANPSDALKVASRALAEVNSRLRPLAGRSHNVKTATSSMSSASTRQSPRSLEEVVRMGLSR